MKISALKEAIKSVKEDLIKCNQSETYPLIVLSGNERIKEFFTNVMDGIEEAIIKKIKE